MPRLSHAPETINAVHIHAKTGISYGVFAVYAVLFAFISHWMWQTVGEPFRVATEQNDRITATNALLSGAEDRNLLQLQSGLTQAADIASFNETLFDSSKALHRNLRMRMDKLAVAVSKAEFAPLSEALTLAIELHDDGRPFVDRYHLRAAAKKLQEVATADEGKAAAVAGMPEAKLNALYVQIKSAIELSRGSEDGPSKVGTDEDEKKLPSPYLPSFWACLSLMGALLALVLTHMSCRWSVAFEALMYYHSTSELSTQSFARITPPPHRGAAEIVPLQQSSNGGRIARITRIARTRATIATATPTPTPTPTPPTKACVTARTQKQPWHAHRIACVCSCSDRLPARVHARR